MPNKQTTDVGLRYVNNDMCYPAIVVIGQLISALKDGLCDPEHTSIVLFQTCGACRVILREGTCSPLTETEKAILSAAEVQSGVRLACQAKVIEKIKIQIPMTSLTSEQRLQLEGEGSAEIGTQDPVLKIFDLEIPEPRIDDLISCIRAGDRHRYHKDRCLPDGYAAAHLCRKRRDHEPSDQLRGRCRQPYRLFPGKSQLP